LAFIIRTDILSASVCALGKQQSLELPFSVFIHSTQLKEWEKTNTSERAK